MKKNKPFIAKALIALGVVLILAAAAAGVIVTLVQERPFSDPDAITAQLEALMPPKKDAVKDHRLDPTMPQVNCGGQNYVGTVKIGETDTLLPVLSSVTRPAMRRIACLHSGSPYDGSMIIGGGKSLACLANITPDCRVTVTDMRGAVFTYQAAEIHRADAFDPTHWDADEFDLILYYDKPFSSEYVIACFAACDP